MYTVTLSLCVQSQSHSLASHCHIVHTRTITLSLFTKSLSHSHTFTVTRPSTGSWVRSRWKHCPYVRSDSVTQTQTVPHHGDCDTVCLSLCRFGDAHSHVDTPCCLRASVAGWLHTVTVAQGHGHCVKVWTHRVKERDSDYVIVSKAHSLSHPHRCVAGWL